MELPQIASRSAWGKFDENTGGRHHLAHHCADVAACFELLLDRWMVQSNGAPYGKVLSRGIRSRLVLIAFLHDVGKLHPGFQVKSLPADRQPCPPRGHGAAGCAAMMKQNPRRIWKALFPENAPIGREYSDVVLASLAHHGRPLNEPPLTAGWETFETPDFVYDPFQAAAELGEAARSWFPEAYAAGRDDPMLEPFAHRFAGLVSLADWLGSDRRFFPFEAEFRKDYIDTARAKANDAMRTVRIDIDDIRMAARGRCGFTALTGHAAPQEHQRILAEFPLTERLVVLEAETGAGKTEAAFWRFARLFEAGLVDSLYFALPTRSAAVQIHGRIEAMLRRLTGEHGLTAVLAVPGYFKSGEAEGEALPNWRVRWDDEGVAAEDALAARWAAENAKRFLAAPVAVGTVDQAMLAALRVKHAHLRAACLARSLLVIDEVHASDRYMAEIQSCLLDTHLGYGGHALLMSATLGAGARVRWLRGRRAKPPGFQDAVAAPYPAIWGRGSPEPVPAGIGGRAKAVAVSLVETMAAEAVAERALLAARRGAKVLVIRNTVTAAVAAWEAIRALDPEAPLLTVAGRPTLHHGRFAVEDRGHLDRAVEMALAHDARRPSEGVIVVGTQTLEQSLDIDADLLITDLCPIDVLLQRIGRLHRHAAVPRPAGFEEAACVVLSPADGLAPLTAPKFDNGLGAFTSGDGGLDGIYLDLAVLELTRRLIAERPRWVIPRDNRWLVESAVHDDKTAKLIAELGGAWQAYDNKVAGRATALRNAANAVLLDVNEPFDMVVFPDAEEAVRTRLGAEGARLTFDRPVIGPFGTEISALTLPAHWSRGLDPAQPVTVTPEGEGLRVAIDGRRFRYDARGLAKAQLE
jgi:CRISPR-associated endonuclease/helicase Cas3